MRLERIVEMRHGKARFVAGFLVLPVGLYVFYVLWPFVQEIGYSFTDWGGYSDDTAVRRARQLRPAVQGRADPQGLLA